MCSNFVEQEASYITQCQRGSLLLFEGTASVSARKDHSAGSPLDIKMLAVFEERERKKVPEETAVNPEMTAVAQCVAYVNYLCYVMLCKTSCCINIL